MPPLDHWGIFYMEEHEVSAIRLRDTILFEFRDSFKYACPAPLMFKIQQCDDLEEQRSAWQRELEAYASSSVVLLVFLIDGRKQKNSLYEQIKTFLTIQKGIPSQCVLVSSLNPKRLNLMNANAKNVSKQLIMQICAKIGGTPWAVAPMPYNDLPTIVCGLDVKKSKFSNQRVVSLVVSRDQNFCNYVQRAFVLQQKGNMEFDY